jgi:cell division protein ZapA
MDGKESIAITVLIGGRPYPLKIQAEDELAVRGIVKEVNEKLNRFQLTYTNKDKQDCMAMALLTYAVDLHKCKQVSSTEDRFSDKLTQLNELLDDLLA